MCSAILGPDTKITYAADWSRIFRPSAGRRPGDVLFPPRSAVGRRRTSTSIGIDNYLPLADWRDGTAHLDSTRSAAPPPSTISPICSANIARRRGLTTGTTPADADRDAQTRTPITDGASASPGCSATRTSGAGGRTRITTAPAASKRHADRLGAAAQADLVHRARLPGGRQGRQPAQRLLRSEIARKRACRISPAARATISCSAASSRRISRSGPTRPTTRHRPRLRRPHGRQPRTSTPGAWDARPYPPSRRAATSGATPPTGGSATGSTAASAPCSWPIWWPTSAPAPTSPTARRRSSDGLVIGYGVTDTMSARDALAPLSTRLPLRCGGERRASSASCRAADPTAGADRNPILCSRPANRIFGFTLTRAQETDLPNASRIQYIDADADYRQAMRGGAPADDTVRPRASSRCRS